ncbi:hypothetical protein SGFS_052770 [Streptomyces graminofaciens]|uniref:Uncharacterized protein n=1 Tax=Streptomyces graminofaciens TaxID=68212 RepID=A0ABN5VKL9_9ACTN|nr:hypothetical protein SGFS_052770 [Streptomyces graminofaciens]
MEQNGPIALDLRPQNAHQSFATGHRSRSSEALRLADPLSCLHTEDSRWRASARLSLVGRWYVALSAQVTVRRASHYV